MTDQEKREKVIKGLECCIIDVPGEPCNCPYDGDGGCIGSLMRDAIALLKAQELRYTPREVRNALIDYGQYDLNIELGEVIKYDPVKIEDILMNGRRACEHPNPIYPSIAKYLEQFGIIIRRDGTMEADFFKANEPMSADVAKLLGVEPKESV